MLNSVKMKTFKFTKEDLEEKVFFSEGVHKVKITTTDINETEDKKTFVEAGFRGDNGAESNIRLWLHTPESRRITVDNVRRILVHNAQDEEVKKAIREKFQKIENLQDFNAFVVKLVGCEAWFKLEKQEDKTYTDKETGEVKPSYRRDLYGFEPKMKNQAKAEKPVARVVEADAEATEHFEVSDEIALSETPF